LIESHLMISPPVTAQQDIEFARISQEV